MWRVSNARRRRQKEEKCDSEKPGGSKRYYDKICKVRIKEIQKKKKIITIKQENHIKYKGQKITKQIGIGGQNDSACMYQ